MAINPIKSGDNSYEISVTESLDAIEASATLAFSTSTLLANAETYDSTVLDMSIYTQVQTAVLSDKDGTIIIDFIRDLAGTDILRTLTIPYVGGSGFEMFSSVAFTPFVRYRFTCDETGQTDFYFDTKFTKTSLSPQILDLEAFISPAMVASLNRSLIIGQNPSNSFSNVKADGYAFNTTVPLANGATYTSGVLDAQGYTQVQTSILSSHIGDITIEFCSDSLGTDVLRTLNIPYSTPDVFQMFSAPAFTAFIKYSFTNDSGSLQTDFYFDTKFLTKSLSGQLLNLDAFISPQMVANLGRNVLVGQDGNGTYSNVSVVETSNDAGTYHSMQVVNGARPSQLFGRTAVSIVVDGVSASSLLHTVTANKTFYVTDINLTVDNSGSVAGVLKLENGIIAAQPVVSCYMIADPPGAASSNTVISHSFIEPLQFDTGVWLNEAAGTLSVCGVINGYEE